MHKNAKNTTVKKAHMVAITVCRWLQKDVVWVPFRTSWWNLHFGSYVHQFTWWTYFDCIVYNCQVLFYQNTIPFCTSIPVICIIHAYCCNFNHRQSKIFPSKFSPFSGRMRKGLSVCVVSNRRSRPFAKGCLKTGCICRRRRKWIAFSGRSRGS